MLLAIPLAGVACNALNGSTDRALDTDASTVFTPHEAGADVTVANDANSADVIIPTTDASDGAATIMLSVDVSMFTTLNDASASATGNGTQIVNFQATHPIIVFMPQTAIPSDDFTLYATVKTPMDGEFGILTRVQPDGHGYIFGSEFGASHRAFLGLVAPPDWNPNDDSNATMSPSWTFVANHEYKFVLRASGNTLTGKMWDATGAEPALPQVTLTAIYSTGRGIGFYTYGAIGALLENMHVTVP